MPDDNPYAAPQTLEPQQLAAPLPVAALQEDLDNDPPQRRRFADWDTARLTALWERSRAIYDMQVVWLVLCFAVPFLSGVMLIPLAFFGHNLLDDVIAFCSVAFLLLTFVRFGTGFSRTARYRVFALGMDGLLGLGCVGASLSNLVAAISEPGAAVGLMFVLPIATLVGFQTGRSLHAMWQAPELFGPRRIRHEDLEDEVEWRTQQREKQLETELRIKS